MRKKVWFFVVIVLSALLVASIAINFWLGFTRNSKTYEMQVGDTVSIQVGGNQSEAVSLVFDSKVLPKEKFPQIVQISSQNLEKSMFVRVKGSFCEIEDDVEFVTSEHFKLNPDGYYYYDSVLNQGEKITFCTELFSNEKMSCGKVYLLTIVVETLDSDLDVSNIWKYESVK